MYNRGYPNDPLPIDWNGRDIHVQVTTVSWVFFIDFNVFFEVGIKTYTLTIYFYSNFVNSNVVFVAFFYYKGNRNWVNLNLDRSILP